MSGWDGIRDNSSPTLFTELPPQTPAVTRTRSNDPITSLLAAADVDMRAKYVEILSKLAEQERGVTYHAVIDAANYGRITELNRAGYVECVGISDRKPRGRLWVISDRGRDAIRVHS